MKCTSLYKIFIVVFFFSFVKQNFAQGTWTALTNVCPDTCGGLMLLLSDGTVMAKSFQGGGDGIGNRWSRLTPDTNGNYANGTWSAMAAMNDTRLYCSSQVLKDGRVYIAGGEYGTGGSSSETYDPLTDTWTYCPLAGQTISDANSKMLPDGKVLQALVAGNYRDNVVYDPLTNTYGSLSTCFNTHDEVSYLGLPDGTILFPDNILFGGGLTSERYDPATNQWIADAPVPDSLYDPYGYETGAGFMLPDGRAFFIGATGHTAYYTPSGNLTPGTWTAGPDLPNNLGPSDGAAAMMVDGKILIASAQKNDGNGLYKSPTWFYEFNYLTNSYLKVSAPIGGDTLSEPCYYTLMLDLPNGEVLFGNLGDLQYYVYTPSGTPLAAGKPSINTITQIACKYRITGTLFNGISEGAAYGDDWQMATNYPIVRLTNGPYVYYARTSDWNRTGVQTGNLLDTTYFTVPAGLQAGTYTLVVTANGISSNPFTFVYTPCTTEINASAEKKSVRVYPNPAIDKTSIEFTSQNGGSFTLKLIDLFGRIVKEEAATALAGNNSYTLNLEGIAKGVYEIVFQKGNALIKNKIVIR